MVSFLFLTAVQNVKGFIKHIYKSDIFLMTQKNKWPLTALALSLHLHLQILEIQHKTLLPDSLS
jgi:hypothetical protein